MSQAHGTALNIVAPRSRFYQGPFGRICRDLPPWSPPGFDPQKDEAAIVKHFLDIAKKIWWRCQENRPQTSRLMLG